MTRTRRGDGQTALVTGASVGIGVDLAECFAADGYDVILAARTESALRAIADRLANTYGIKATPIVADLGVIGGGQRLADAIQKAGSDRVSPIGTGLVEISYGSNHLTCASDGVGCARTPNKGMTAHRAR